MPAPRSITSDAQIGAEGLYIRSERPPSSVEGVQVNTVGIAGRTVRGPVGRAVEITSGQRFLDVFGGRDHGGGGAIIGEIWKALLGLPFGKLVVCRAAAAAAATAEADFLATATPIINVAASSPGLWGADLEVSVEAATDGDANHFNLRVDYLGKSVVYPNLDVTAGQDNLAQVIGDDDANLVVVTKLADGRPDNVADQALDDTAGADGTLADADFTAANGPIDILANRKDVGIVLVAGQSTAAVKTSLNGKAAASPKKLFLCCPDASSTTKAAAVTEVATLRTTNGRMIYCFNHYKALDPETATLIVKEPHAVMASILSQTDADVHPGADSTRDFTASVRGLSWDNLSELDYDDFRDAGICALEQHELGGFVFVSGVTTSLERREITERRMRDYIMSGISGRASADVKEPNTQARRTARSGAIGAWLSSLARSGRYVDLINGEPEFVYDTESLNTPESRATGLQKDLARVRLIAFGLFIVIHEEMGTTVRTTEGN